MAYKFPGTVVLAEQNGPNQFESIDKKFAEIEDRLNLLTRALQRSEIQGQYLVNPPSPTVAQLSVEAPGDAELILRLPAQLLTKNHGDTYYAVKGHTHPPGPGLVAIQEGGTPKGQAGTLNVVGATAAVTAGIATLTFTGGGGSGLEFQDEGSPEGPATTLNVTGGGASVSVVGSTATLNVPAPAVPGLQVLYTTPVSSDRVDDTAGEFIFNTQAQIDANSALVGDTFYLIVGGRWGASSTVINYIWRVYANAGVILSRSMHAYTNPLIEAFFMVCQFTVRAVGASGKITGNGLVGMDSNDTFSPGTRQMSNLVQEKDIDTTVNNLIKVSIEFSSAPPGTFMEIETMSLLRARAGS